MVGRRKCYASDAAPATAPARRITRGMMSKKRVANREAQIDKTKNELLELLSNDHSFDKDVADAAASFIAVLQACQATEAMLESLPDPSDKDSVARTMSQDDTEDETLSSTELDQVRLAKGLLVAFSLSNRSKKLWTLGKIVGSPRADGKYNVSEGHYRGTKHWVDRECIRIVPTRPPDWEPGTKVMAVYPGTDTFYPAELIERGKLSWLLAFDNEGPNATYVKEVTFGALFIP